MQEIFMINLTIHRYAGAGLGHSALQLGLPSPPSQSYLYGYGVPDDLPWLSKVQEKNHTCYQNKYKAINTLERLSFDDRQNGGHFEHMEHIIEDSINMGVA